MFKKIISLFLSLSLIITQPIFAQGVAQLNIAQYLGQTGPAATDSFRPTQLRYFSYDSFNNSFRILLDKGDVKDIKDNQLKEQAKELMDYFLIGLALPNDTFWVNLRPDSPDNIIDPELEKTDLGRILLEADLQLKKDTANFTSPKTPEGKQYWDKLYKKAGELFGSENITIPTITRPWIVPGEIIVRESGNSAYIYKATLKVLLEQDYLKDSSVYNFPGTRLKELNEYSSQIIRETIIPKLSQEVNSSKRYAKLRQVYYSLVLSRWFKMRFAGKSGQYADLIDRHNLTNLTAKEPYDKLAYFKQYQESFAKGEYNLKEPVYTPYGQSIRAYMSGGFNGTKIITAGVAVPETAGSSILGEYLKNRPDLLPLEISGVELQAGSFNYSPKIAMAASPMTGKGTALFMNRLNKVRYAIYNYLHALDVQIKRDKKNKIKEYKINEDIANLIRSLRSIAIEAKTMMNKGEDEQYEFLRNSPSRAEELFEEITESYSEFRRDKALGGNILWTNCNFYSRELPNNARWDSEMSEIFEEEGASYEFLEGVFKNTLKDNPLDKPQSNVSLQITLHSRRDRVKINNKIYKISLVGEGYYSSQRYFRFYKVVIESKDFYSPKNEYTIVYQPGGYVSVSKGSEELANEDFEKLKLTELRIFARKIIEEIKEGFASSAIVTIEESKGEGRLGDVPDNKKTALAASPVITLKEKISEVFEAIEKKINDQGLRNYQEELAVFLKNLKKDLEGPVGEIDNIVNAQGTLKDAVKAIERVSTILFNRENGIGNIHMDIKSMMVSLRRYELPSLMREIEKSIGQREATASPVVLESDLEVILEARKKLNEYHNDIKNFSKVSLSDLIASLNGTAKEIEEVKGSDSYGEQKEWLDIATELSNIRDKVVKNKEMYREQLSSFYEGVKQNPDIKLGEGQELDYNEYARTIKATNDPDEIIAAAELAYKLAPGAAASPLTIEEMRKLGLEAPEDFIKDNIEPLLKVWDLGDVVNLNSILTMCKMYMLGFPGSYMEKAKIKDFNGIKEISNTMNTFYFNTNFTERPENFAVAAGYLSKTMEDRFAESIIAAGFESLQEKIMWIIEESLKKEESSREGISAREQYLSDMSGKSSGWKDVMLKGFVKKGLTPYYLEKIFRWNYKEKALNKPGFLRLENTGVRVINERPYSVALERINNAGMSITHRIYVKSEDPVTNVRYAIVIPVSEEKSKKVISYSPSNKQLEEQIDNEFGKLSPGVLEDFLVGVMAELKELASSAVKAGDDAILVHKTSASPLFFTDNEKEELNNIINKVRAFNREYIGWVREKHPDQTIEEIKRYMNTIASNIKNDIGLEISKIKSFIKEGKLKNEKFAIEKWERLESQIENIKNSIKNKMQNEFQNISVVDEAKVEEFNEFMKKNWLLKAATYVGFVILSNYNPAAGKWRRLAKDIIDYRLGSSQKTSASSITSELEISAFPRNPLGGIDFTSRAMKIGIERMGSFADLKLVLPEVSNAAAIDLDNEFKQIELMASSGIRPSDTRILEFAAACYYRGEFGPRMGEITSCLQQAHFLDERLGRESSEALRLATILPEVIGRETL